MAGIGSGRTVAQVSGASWGAQPSGVCGTEQRLPFTGKNVTMITMFARGLCSNLSSDNVPRANIGSLCAYLRIVQETVVFNLISFAPFKPWCPCNLQRDTFGHVIVKISCVHTFYELSFDTVVMLVFKERATDNKYVVLLQFNLC